MTIIAANDQVASDAEVARALQEQFRQEEEEAAAARSASTREATAPPPSRVEHFSENINNDAVVAQRLVDEELRAAEAFETSMYSGGLVGGDAADDAEVSRRLDQEARDAAFAASLAQQDVAYASSRQVAGTIVAHDETAQRRLRRRRSLNSCITCFGAIAIAFMLFWFLGRRNVIPGVGSDGGNPFDDLADWFGGGGWEGDYKTTGEDIPWSSSRTSRNGLDLKVLNNLDEKWQGIFDTVMSEWDNGEPDTVSFTIERISDPSCRMVPGAMVVCNGNYGRTSWRGINELLTNNGYIVSSVAKLNEYFLDGRNDDLRQYVCCHEIGHGLGLGHTDEGQYNPDLGECMDYTVNPGVNKHPGRTNFEALEQMYGRADDGRNRYVRGLLRSDLPEQNMNSVEYSSDDIEWRVLRRTERYEHYEADLGDGNKLRRVLLLA